MKNSLQYIEEYFTGQLTDKERIDFERRCETDTGFAREVGFYISLRGAVKKTLYEGHAKADLRPSAIPVSGGKKTISLVAYISGIAATVLILMMAYFYFDRPNPQKIASTYIAENLETISVTMGSRQDSMAMGINAYNEKNFQQAESIFKSLSTDPALEFDCIKNLGIVSLANGSYENALRYFDQLAKREGRYANPGLFYKALTLMKRDSGSDEEDAKQILQLVVKEKMAGHKEASRWLEKLD